VDVLRNEVAMKEEMIQTTGVRERELQTALATLTRDYEDL
jgi:hypothetical protein